MCEVLVRAKTNGPTGDHWNRGDIVAAQPDGHLWGRLETKAAWIASGGLADEWPEEFYLIKIPGRTAVDFETAYKMPWRDATGTVVLARSIWQFRIDDLSDTDLRKLRDTGEFTADTAIRRSALEAIFRNKSSQETGTV